ncbi:hypothetical protein L211DRAFT_145544 [Terfezia boudieri ATCC MYA-4762]|uniref:Uncharacterized protein n=1 Tax=Terfezia boudieri ATCC MYA-4762 TaxID=1051890 RepID=A0A3N4M361_9PEZI|nr:hypothetical protein L211DRAFT_145544 [Terfezia boudieri ATCC MYA-4762]
MKKIRLRMEVFELRACGSAHSHWSQIARLMRGQLPVRKQSKKVRIHPHRTWWACWTCWTWWAPSCWTCPCFSACWRGGSEKEKAMPVTLLGAN